MLPRLLKQPLQIFKITKCCNFWRANVGTNFTESSWNRPEVLWLLNFPQRHVTWLARHRGVKGCPFDRKNRRGDRREFVLEPLNHRKFRIKEFFSIFPLVPSSQVHPARKSSNFQFPVTDRAPICKINTFFFFFHTGRNELSPLARFRSVHLRRAITTASHGERSAGHI